MEMTFYFFERPLSVSSSSCFEIRADAADLWGQRRQARGQWLGCDPLFNFLTNTKTPMKSMVLLKFHQKMEKNTFEKFT